MAKLLPYLKKKELSDDVPPALGIQYVSLLLKMNRQIM